MTTTYQPKTKDYNRHNIYINPALWSKFQELRFYSGYSMSFLIRVMLEWEMEEEGGLRSILIEKPELTEEERKEIPHTQQYSYDIRVRVKYKTREVYMKFLDEYD